MFDDLYHEFTNFFYRLFLTLITVLEDLFFWIINTIFNGVVHVLSGLSNLFGQMDVSSYISSVPSQVSWVFIQVGLPNALLIISSAIGIRLILQLIPFVRLGS